MLVSGNPNFGLAQSLHKLYPDAEFCSRANGYDLCNSEHQTNFAQRALNHSVVVVSSALWKFNQTLVVEAVYLACREHKHPAHIIAIGSTTDRVKNGKAWRYNAEKKALRDWCNTLAIGGVWSDNLPKVSYISFGTLSNNQHKHPDRRTMNIDTAAEYIKWIADQPAHININELSIDPVQGSSWYKD